MRWIMGTLILGLALLAGCGGGGAASSSTMPSRLEARDEFVCQFTFSDSQAPMPGPNDTPEMIEQILKNAERDKQTVRIPIPGYSTVADQSPLKLIQESSMHGMDFSMRVQPVVTRYDPANLSDNYYKRGDFELYVREVGASPFNMLFKLRAVVGMGAAMGQFTIPRRPVGTGQADSVNLFCGLFNVSK